MQNFIQMNRLARQQLRSRMHCNIADAQTDRAHIWTAAQHAHRCERISSKTVIVTYKAKTAQSAV